MSWRKEQGQDKFFRLAKNEGYRARSAYKLLEICEKHKLIRSGEIVLDLGAAPGSWSQVARQRVGPTGIVVAVDLQDILPIPGVETVVGDVRDAGIRATLRAKLGRPAHVVLSDVAPNASGILVTDQARAIELATEALATATLTLRPGGAFVVKVFRGEEFDRFLSVVRRNFHKVFVVIPAATRNESREVYVVGRGFTIGIAPSGATNRTPEVGAKTTRTGKLPSPAEWPDRD